MQIAEIVASGLESGNRSDVLNSAAAWLINNGKIRQSGYLIKDIYWVLEQRGYLFAKVTSAKSLSDSHKTSITSFIKKHTGAKTVEIVEIVDPSVKGGFKIETPSRVYDKTVINRLNELIREVA